jgi:hypothetical protein
MIVGKRLAGIIRIKYPQSIGFVVLRFEKRFVFQENEDQKNETTETIKGEMNLSDRRINHLSLSFRARPLIPLRVRLSFKRRGKCYLCIRLLSDC